MNTPPRICPNCYGMWFKYSEDTLVTLKFGKEERQFRTPGHTCRACGEVIVETRPHLVDEIDFMKSRNMVYPTQESGVKP